MRPTLLLALALLPTAHAAVGSAALPFGYEYEDHTPAAAVVDVRQAFGVDIVEVDTLNATTVFIKATNATGDFVVVSITTQDERVDHADDFAELDARLASLDDELAALDAELARMDGGNISAAIAAMRAALVDLDDDLAGVAEDAEDAKLEARSIHVPDMEPLTLDVRHNSARLQSVETAGTWSVALNALTVVLLGLVLVKRADARPRFLQRGGSDEDDDEVVADVVNIEEEAEQARQRRDAVVALLEIEPEHPNADKWRAQYGLSGGDA